MKFSTAAAILALTTSIQAQAQTELIFDDTPAFALGGPATLLFDSAKAEAEAETGDNTRLLRGKRKEGTKEGKKKDRKACDPSDVVLADYPQWNAEKGYWIGEYSFYGPDGKPYASAWPYEYDAYRGFITGGVEGNAYRQRNVFLYPPARNSTCERFNLDLQPNVTGDGECGVNGNSLVFFADQEATTCSDNPELAGDVNGPFNSAFGPLPTTTELVGDGNALLYQVYVPGFLCGQSTKCPNPLQSQLTTLTKGPGSDEFDLRTRTAQGLNFVTGQQTYASFYRERKVTEEEFYSEMNNTIAEYNILDSDLCFLDGGAGRAPVANYTAGYEQCVAHLQTSFDL